MSNITIFLPLKLCPKFVHRFFFSDIFNILHLAFVGDQLVHEWKDNSSKGPPEDRIMYYAWNLYTIFLFSDIFNIFHCFFGQSSVGLAFYFGKFANPLRLLYLGTHPSPPQFLVWFLVVWTSIDRILVR